MASRLLVVEDDPLIGASLEQCLVDAGYAVRWARTATDADVAASHEPPDLVLLDLGLPDVDGIVLCRRLREAFPQTVIVMLTARVEEIDVVVGLDAGADDYITKPFRLAVLLARVRAHLRRNAAPMGLDEIDVDTLHIQASAHRAELGGRALDLRPKEFDLLVLLAVEAGKVVTRERIMAEVWDEHWFGPTKTLDMHISSLRKKLGDHADLITTIRRVGYRMERP